MFDSLAARLADITAKIRGRGRIDEKDVKEVGREIRLALLEADVDYKVVKEIVAGIADKAVGESVTRSVTPAQQVIKIVYDELAGVMGGEAAQFSLKDSGRASIMLAGLQGSGKTTAAVKLALWFKKSGKKPLLVAADTHRPAAIEQLTALGKETGVDVFQGRPGDKPELIAVNAMLHATKTGNNLVIIDTAGRTHIDAEMMEEAVRIKDAVKPDHILFVADSMLGQDAVTQASAFNETFAIAGVILTKLDGDARGGAALSILRETGRPILFVSTGEKPKDFEVFHPERMASRILGMGDVLSLVEKAEDAVAKDEAEELAAKLMRDEFDLNDFLAQLEQIRKMGGLNDMISMLPANMMPKQLRGAAVDESALSRTKAVIQSMTAEERKNPKIINGSRRARIAKGSGTTTAEVNGLIKQYEMMRKMVKSMKGGKRKNALPFMMG
jgi:signal recognition particle subunit SRP54